MESEAIVVGLAGDYALVEVQDRQVGCGHCHEPGGCGGTLLAQMRPLKERSYQVLNLINAAIGDTVVVTLPEGRLWRASFAAYLLPLSGVLLGAASGTLLGSEASAVGGSLLGFGAGLLILKHSERQRSAGLLAMRFRDGDTCRHMEVSDS